MTIKKGATVRLKMPVIEGIVSERKFDDDTDQMQYAVNYVGEDGEAHQRWFGEAQLEVTKEAPEPKEAA